jgi:6-phosphogluconolactonase
MVLLHIGTYAGSGGRGLVPVELRDDGALVPGEPFADAANASFAVTGNGLVYAVDESEEGAVNVLRRTGETWKHVSRVTAGGAEPCYLCLSPDHRRLAVANYKSGSAALYRLDRDGMPQSPPAVFQNVGSGPNAERQEGPHVHCVRFAPEGTGLFLVDLGTDQVVCLELTEEGFGEASVAWTAPAGYGPRHMLLHPSVPRALVLGELSATLTMVQRGPLGFETLDRQPTAPSGYKGENLGGHLAVNPARTRTYVSNRGHDALAVFALVNGHLEPLQTVSSGGAHPRHFALVPAERKLVVAHEKDGTVASFEIEADGRLRATGHSITVPGACFVLAP